VLRFRKPKTRLHRLLAVAAVLAVGAVASNYAYWRKGAAHPSPAAKGRGGTPDSLPSASSIEIQLLRARLRQSPADFEARLHLSQLYFIDKEYAGALAELEVLGRAQPDNPEIFFRRAMVEK